MTWPEAFAVSVFTVASRVVAGAPRVGVPMQTRHNARGSADVVRGYRRWWRMGKRRLTATGAVDVKRVLTRGVFSVSVRKRAVIRGGAQRHD